MPTLHVQLEERDYVNAVQAAARPSVRTVTLLAIASAFVIIGALVGWRAGYMREAIIIRCVWCFGLIGAWIGQMVSIAPKAKRVFRQQKGLRRPHEVSWNAVGLTVSGEDGQSTTRWADFHRVRELDDQFILFLSDAVFVMIPKRTFPDRSLMQSFHESVTSKIRRS
jgi:YcxB-like protein